MPRLYSPRTATLTAATPWGAAALGRCNAFDRRRTGTRSREHILHAGVVDGRAKVTDVTKGWMGRTARLVVVVCLTASGTAVYPLGASASHLDGREDRNGLIVFSYVPLCCAAGDIWVVEPDGSGLRNLTNHPAHDTMPAWSPDGKHIAFMRSDVYGPLGGLQWDVYVMDADGSGIRNVTRTPEVSEGTPDWSPDGSKLIFERYTDDGQYLYTMNVAGSGARRLTRGANPSWSPDGEWIAFDTGGGSAAEDWVLMIRPDGTGRGTVRPGDTDDSHPDWSPDGRRIVFSRDEGLVIVKRDGNGLRTLYPEEGYEYEMPSWAPNGERLVVVHRGQIYTMNLQGEALKRLTDLLPGFPGYPDWRATIQP